MAGTPAHSRPGNTQEPKVVVRRAVLSAFCASLIGIGFVRFAYTPLLPAIIGAHWVTASAAAYLAAANLAGYLAGALLGRQISARLSPLTTLRAMMLLAMPAFFARGYPLSFTWFFIWRFASGLVGGALMVLAAPAVLPHVPASRRGPAAGAIPMGVSAGVAASGPLVSLQFQQVLERTWFGLGAIFLLLTLVAWTGWPGAATPDTNGREAPHAPRPKTRRTLYAEYGLNAAGWVPRMIFLGRIRDTWARQRRPDWFRILGVVWHRSHVRAGFDAALCRSGRLWPRPSLGVSP